MVAMQQIPVERKNRRRETESEESARYRRIRTNLTRKVRGEIVVPLPETVTVLEYVGPCPVILVTDLGESAFESGKRRVTYRLPADSKRYLTAMNAGDDCIRFQSGKGLCRDHPLKKCGYYLLPLCPTWATVNAMFSLIELSLTDDADTAEEENRLYILRGG
jgi:hypothetical protein